jgi:hypothetical protein
MNIVLLTGVYFIGYTVMYLKVLQKYALPIDKRLKLKETKWYMSLICIGRYTLAVQMFWAR